MLLKYDISHYFSFFSLNYSGPLNSLTLMIFLNCRRLSIETLQLVMCWLEKEKRAK